MLKAILFYALGAVTPLVAMVANNYVTLSRCAEVLNVYACDARVIYLPKEMR